MKTLLRALGCALAFSMVTPAVAQDRPAAPQLTSAELMARIQSDKKGNPNRQSMKPDRMIRLALAVWPTATFLLMAEPANAETGRPNIVIFLFDDMGWGQPQSYNPKSALRTPNLDKLASQGMRFTDAHTGAAVCTPTRYGVLTGRYPSRIGQFGVLGTWSPPIIPTSRATVASILKQQGYHTACVGKWHLGLAWGKEGKGGPPVGARFVHGPTELGFDYFCGYTHAANISTVLEQDRVVAQVAKEENQPLLLRKAVAWWCFVSMFCSFS